MHIAFVSYEYPPGTVLGGIANSVKQAASLLISRGHKMEVFAGSQTRSGIENENGSLVHRIQGIGGTQAGDPQDFPTRIAPLFAQRHQLTAFDVPKGPEYRAEARDAVQLVPDIPLQQTVSLLGARDILIFPSLCKSFGRTRSKAMPDGRGVVATDPSGMAKMLYDGSEEFKGLVHPEEQMRLGSAARLRLRD